VGLIESIGAGPVGIDTAAFSYFVEQHAVYADVMRPIFARADSGQLDLVTSAVSRLEVLIVAYRAGNAALAAQCEALFTSFVTNARRLPSLPGLRVVQLDAVRA
jgi:predicted nucleic acid-binding protein